MSFRFQKRVSVAPGVRLNFSKRGISTTVGRQGASVSLGKKGLYGNIGIPGSGLSYRSRLDKGAAGQRHYESTEKLPYDANLVYDDSSHSFTFVDRMGDELPANHLRELKKQNASKLKELYKEKEREINEQTTKLLEIHHELSPPKTVSEIENEIREETTVTASPPQREEIYLREKAKLENETSSFLKVLRFLSPKQKDEFNERVKQQTIETFNNEQASYDELIELAKQERTYRIDLLHRMMAGSLEAMDEWLTMMLEKLDFPIDTDIDFQVLGPKTVYVDVKLPPLQVVPVSKASILKSGKLKIERKSKKQQRNHYAKMVGGAALYLSSYIFSLLPNCDRIVLSGYTIEPDPVTGHDNEWYLYSIDVDRETLYTLKMRQVHPIQSFKQFHPRMDATKTYIFKPITPYEPEEITVYEKQA
ncbi:DUF4236 domain-containing protein [Thalassorhabdus alkalitolerans]|uniref:DUF4236 domain-containing protein n=1 Tax=Thalassorhabdus alkalitolerans TaxID=2282697 RepID=A0ABW0YLJ2_9BACI